MKAMLDALRGGLIVSVQAYRGSAIDDPNVLSALALAASLNGARAVRMQGVENLLEARKRVRVPIIGLIKREYPGFEPYITPTGDEVRDVLRTGADIVAFDATRRERPHGEALQALIAVIHGAGRVAMADCATVEDARDAVQAGADIIATTLCGYTKETAGSELPAVELVASMRALGTTFVICEGGVGRPAQVSEALAAGADAVVVGSAISNIDWLVRGFAAAADNERAREGEK